MKQYIIGSMLLSSILLASCSLDETPRSKFSEEEAFSTSKLVYVNTVANVYSSIGNGLYGSDGGSVHTFQEFSSDASMIPGRQGDWVDGGTWQNIFLIFQTVRVRTRVNIMVVSPRLWHICVWLSVPSMHRSIPSMIPLQPATVPL